MRPSSPSTGRALDEVDLLPDVNGHLLWALAITHKSPECNPIVTTLTDQDTTYTPGNQLDLNGTTLDVEEGAGSRLDADLVDGQEATAFALNSHNHFGAAWSGATPNDGLHVQNNHRTSGLVGVATAGSGLTYGVQGLVFSAEGYGGNFVSLGGNGTGLYALGGNGGRADIVLGGNDSTGAGADERHIATVTPTASPWPPFRDSISWCDISRG